MNTRKLLGLIGSITLFIGVFTPIVSIPLIGNANYFRNGQGDGTIVLILAVISIILVLKEKYKWLWYTGIGSLGIMLFSFLNFQSIMSKAKLDMKSELAGNPFRGLADVAIQSVQLEWGWALLIFGATCVIASAAKKDNPQVQTHENRSFLNNAYAPNRQERECPHCAELILAKAKVCKHCGSDVDEYYESDQIPFEVENIDMRINDREDTLLIMAAREGNLKLVIKLVSLGAEKNIKNIWGLTALDVAEKAGKEEVVAFLSA